MKNYLEDLMRWVRRRIRQYLWKQWKNGTNRKHRLRQLGVSEEILKRWKLGSNSYWRMARCMNHLLKNRVIHKHYDLLDGVEFYRCIHAKRIEVDKVVLDWRYHSLFG